MLSPKKGLGFYLKADTVFSSQSMLFHDFYDKVLKDTSIGTSKTLERERQKYIRDETLFDRKDLGAGHQTGKISVSQIARTALSTTVECRRLHRLASFLKPEKVLELGTSLGISSAYLVSGHPKMIYLGVEGDPYLANHTTKLINKLGSENASVHNSSIQEALSEASSKGEIFDLVYMDGHHDYGATMRYFDQVLDLVSAEAIVVLDDITWSTDMLKAWEEVRRHPKVKASLSYMGVGYLFFSNRFLVPMHEDWLDIGFKPWTRWWSW